MTFNELVAHVSTSTGTAGEGVKKILDASIAMLTEKAAAGEDSMRMSCSIFGGQC
jgi:hypothetical protein